MSPYFTFKIISLVIMFITLIIMMVNRMSNQRETNDMNDNEEVNAESGLFTNDVDPNVEKECEESKQRFIDWHSHATSKQKQKMLKTALFYNERYDKDEDIRDYDIQDRMQSLKRELNESQLSEIYPDIRALSSYISGGFWTSYWKEKEFLDYFRKTYNRNELYDYETFLSVMVVPGTASWRGIRPHARNIKVKIQELGGRLNKGLISDEEYKKQLHMLLDDYFNNLTRDADAQLRAMEEYEAEIELAHHQKKMSDREYQLHKPIMLLIKHNQEDFCNRVYFD